MVMLATAMTLCCQSAFAEKCENVVQQLNRQLSPRIDEKELVEMLRALNASGNTTLPAQFVTKKQAKKFGWRPGSDLSSIPRLQGKSIGGDNFGNYEGRLPGYIRTWREADLDYKGGHRGAKRLIYSREGKRNVTVDHYRTFHEVPPCQ
ncbi:MAG: ribonuclease [Desulfuromonadales bacterium]|nr:ribonuclease [Desulfuromonadales bacterium]